MYQNVVQPFSFLSDGDVPELPPPEYSPSADVRLVNHKEPRAYFVDDLLNAFGGSSECQHASAQGALQAPKQQRCRLRGSILTRRTKIRMLPNRSKRIANALDHFARLNGSGSQSTPRSQRAIRT